MSASEGKRSGLQDASRWAGGPPREEDAERRRTRTGAGVGAGAGAGRGRGRGRKMHLQSDDALAQPTARRLALLEAFAENAGSDPVPSRFFSCVSGRGRGGIVLHLGDR